MNILIACEESQVVCKAFREKGHRAYSCDIQDCSGGHPEWHIKGDVIPILDGRCEFVTQNGDFHYLNDRWDMIIAHPPCTFMSKAGARWMYPKAGEVSEVRLKKAIAARNFFYRIYNANCDKICIENPTPLKVVGLPQCTQKIQPYQFGHNYSKLTLLWLVGLVQLEPTKIVTSYTPYCPSNTSNFSKGFGGSCGVAHGSKARSKTFEGVAKAMAEQWG